MENQNYNYLTYYNLERNGITETVIRRFQNKVRELGKKTIFFSIDEIKHDFSKDPVVLFCMLDDNQLKQFVEPIDIVKKISFDSGEYLFYCGEEKAKGALLTFIMGNNESMTLYEIEDFVDDKFGVKYLESDIQNDVRFTTFYYSEEMQKIYKNKQVFLKEIYGV